MPAESQEYGGVIAARLSQLQDVNSAPPSIGDTIIWDGDEWVPGPSGGGEGGGGEGGSTAWWQMFVQGDMPVETFPILQHQDTTSEAISIGLGSPRWVQSAVEHLAIPAGSTITSIQLIASAPQRVHQCRLMLQRLTDANGTFLVFPGAYGQHISIFNPADPGLATVELGPYAALAVSGAHFSFPDVDNADYNVASSIITIKNAGHYRLIADCEWEAA